MLSRYYTRNYVRSKKEGEEMIKIRFFMLCWFMWAYFRDYRRKTKLEQK